MDARLGASVHPSHHNSKYVAFSSIHTFTKTKVTNTNALVLGITTESFKVCLAPGVLIGERRNTAFCKFELCAEIADFVGWNSIGTSN